MNLKNYNHIHLIGIGGINVSAIAKLAKSAGIKVSGSDLVATDLTRSLEKDGIEVMIGHKKDNISPEVDLIIFTEAIPTDNPERAEAAAKNIESLTAFQFWGKYSQDKKVVAISGTNGKSTTTAMLGLIMEEAGLDPTVVVGTKVLQWGSNIRLGKSEWLVIEADEYHAHMLELNPYLVVLTNITPDHLDFYKDLADIVSHFQKWIDKLPADGGIVINAQDPASQKLNLPNVTKRVYSVGGSENVRSAGLTVKSGADNEWSGYIAFNIVDDQEDWGFVEMRVPGLFNVANALAAASGADILGIKRKHILTALSKFKGTWRRFEMIGEYNGALVVSDYAHHPDGIKATLAAARGWYPFKKIVLVYQPHQHNRTRKLFDEFVTSFDKADELILAEIYDVAGRTEAADQIISSKDLAEAIKNHLRALAPRVNEGEDKGGLTPDHVFFTPDLASAETMVKERVNKGDVVIIMGAGDIDKVARNLVKDLINA